MSEIQSQGLRALRKTLVLISGGILAGLVLWFYLSSGDLIDDNGVLRRKDEVKRQVTCSFTIRNKTAHVISDGRLQLYAPVLKTSFQECLAIDVSIPFHLITTPLGNQVLEFNITDLPPYGTRIVQIRADLNVSAFPGAAGPDRSFDFLSPEPYIESDHPDIIAAARDLEGRDDLSTAENIFRFVSAHIHDAGYIEQIRGAHDALVHRKGDCTEYALLFTALCRASRIPARCMGGYICTESRILGASGYHNWAEVYINGAWRIVDCQKGLFLQNESDYVAFQIISGQEPSVMPLFQRFSYKGDGMEVIMNN